MTPPPYVISYNPRLDINPVIHEPAALRQLCSLLLKIFREVRLGWCPHLIRDCLTASAERNILRSETRATVPDIGPGFTALLVCGAGDANGAR